MPLYTPIREKKTKKDIKKSKPSPPKKARFMPVDVFSFMSKTPRSVDKYKPRGKNLGKLREPKQISVVRNDNYDVRQVSLGAGGVPNRDGQNAAGSNGSGFVDRQSVPSPGFMARDNLKAHFGNNQKETANPRSPPILKKRTRQRSNHKQTAGQQVAIREPSPEAYRARTAASMPAAAKQFWYGAQAGPSLKGAQQNSFKQVNKPRTNFDTN